MIIYEVYGVFQTRIREKEVDYMDDNYVWKDGLYSPRYSSTASHEPTMKLALLTAVQITHDKIKFLENNYKELESELLERIKE
jgi:hypothetical protein